MTYMFILSLEDHLLLHVDDVEVVDQDRAELQMWRVKGDDHD